jgi:PAS domain S-box-containing protein
MKDFRQIDKNEILDDLFNNDFVAILIVDKKRNTKIVNSSFCNLFGYSQEELINKNALIYHLNDDNFNNFREIAFDKIIKNEPVSLNYEFKKKDGTTFWAKISGHPAKNKHHVVWMLVDITETVQIRNKLKEQTILLETVINENPNPIVLKNYNAKFILVNKATANLYNATPEDMIGKDDGDYIPDKKLADFFKKNVQEIMNKGETKIVYEDSIDVKTNETRNYMSIKKPFRNSQGEKFILVIANDITELNKKNKELVKKEKLLFQQSKLAAMGEMIGNIAHQWRQPLSSISMLSTGVKLEDELGILKKEDFILAMDNINNTTQYLSQTIEDFSNFFNPQNSNVTTFRIKYLINKSMNLLNSQFKNNNINIIEEINNFEINSFENELIQVLLNILNNSKDALVQIKKNRFIQIKTYSDLEFAYIQIHDNAKGIPLEIIDKIFEPYFTTKHKSQGTGIGLFMAKEIIQKHLNGKISVENKSLKIKKNNYEGALFTIKIPLNL